MRRAVCAPIRDRTNSAPVRVLPNPRPASNSHTRQSPGGGSCSSRAQKSQSVTRARLARGVISRSSCVLVQLGCEASQTALNLFKRVLVGIGLGFVLRSPRGQREQAEM